MFQDSDIFKAALDNLPVGVYMVDTQLRIMFWSRGAERISGYLAQDMLGRHCREKLLVDLDENNPVACGEACQLTDSMRNGQSYEADVLLRHRTGHRIPVHVRAAPLKDSHDKIVGATECFEESRFSAARDRRGKGTETSAAGIDAATGLLDTTTTHLRLRESMTEFNERQTPFCVLVAEVDGLSKFQQIHGKEVVVAACVVVGHTLSNALRPSDVVGCWDGHRFLAIVMNCERSMLKRVGERIRKMESYSQVEWWGDELPVSVSIGGTAAVPGDDVDTLVERAQAALRHSVNEGGNRVSVFPEDEIGGLKP
jgi:PAS domain S-box-containing protein/diguanylate cyclase (GGDEF)-like protein